MADVPFEVAAKRVDEFIHLLEDIGLPIKVGSETESDALAASEIVDVWHGRRLPPDDPRRLVRAALGFVDLAGKVMSVADTSDFDKLRPHLAMVGQGSIIQNTTSSVLDEVSNKMIELYVACLAIKAGFSDVELDHPIRASGDNPDVMFDFRGKRWAIALKTLHSTQPQTVFDNVTKAADQIEASSAEAGLVMLNVKNVLEHDVLWPGIAQTEQAGRDALVGQLSAVAHLLDDIPSATWKAVFGPDRKAQLPILLVGHTAFDAIPEAGSSTSRFMPLKAMMPYLNPEGDPSGAMKLAEALNHEMQQFA